MEKILSIIIPTYNMEKYLDKCLTSLIINNLKLMNLLEVLVIIDGAKDRSSEIAHTYQKKFPNTFYVIDKENGNYGSCINRGLRECSGKYIKVLDADDSFNTNNFEKFVSLLINIDVDLVISDFVYKNEFDEDGSLRNRHLETGKVLSFEEVADNFNKCLISMHELTYNRKVFEGLNYHQTEGISYTDLEWCFSPMINVKTIFYFNLVVYRYLIGREGQTVDPAILVKSLPNKIKTGETMIQLYEKLQTDDIHKSYLTRRITWSNSDIYYTYLIYPCVGNWEELIRFDSFIKVTSSLHYFQLEKSIVSRRLPIRFIKLWRKQKDMKEPSFWLKVLEKVAKFVLS